MIEEKIIVGTKEYPLNGLLTIPGTGTAPYPAVVLVHGSGAQDMNEKVGKTYFFKDMAEGLVKHGIASIRYDKRTFVHGKKMVKEFGGDLTVWHETIEDAILAAELVRKDSRVDPSRVFIAGHSMGGCLAPRIDVEGGDFAGLIILASSPRRLEEIIKDQQEDFLESSKGIIRWIASKQIKKISATLDKLYKISDEEAKKTPLFGKYNMLYYLQEWGKKPVSEYFEESQKPVLIMHGGKDVQVTVEKDFNTYKEILADYPQASFKLYPNLNHMLMPSVYNEISKVMKEYKKPQNIESYVIADIVDWINTYE